MYQRLHFDLIVQLIIGIALAMLLLIPRQADAVDVLKIRITADRVDGELIRIIRTEEPIWSSTSGFSFSWDLEPKKKEHDLLLELPEMIQLSEEDMQPEPLQLAPIILDCSLPQARAHSF